MGTVWGMRVDLYDIARVVDKPRSAVSGLLFSHWYRQARKRALGDPVWAEIEAKRHDPAHPGTAILLSDELSMQDWETQHEIFYRLNPTPWWRHVDWWLDKHGLAHQLRSLQDFYQRGRRGFADCDVWNLDHYLDTTIAAALEQLRDTGHGYPAGMTDAEWNVILTDIVAGLRTDPDAEEGTPEHDARQRALDLFVTHYGSFWD